MKATSLTTPGRDLIQRPYRWRGIPNWDPAATAEAKHADDIAVTCPQCGAPPGVNCHASGGRVYQDYEASHSLRRRAPRQAP